MQDESQGLQFSPTCPNELQVMHSGHGRINAGSIGVQPLEEVLQ